LISAVALPTFSIRLAAQISINGHNYRLAAVLDLFKPSHALPTGAVILSGQIRILRQYNLVTGSAFFLKAKLAFPPLAIYPGYRKSILGNDNGLASSVLFPKA
jgi:hypothetical protein